VTMSFGVAFFSPGSILSQKEWVKQADQSLYEAKRKGRNRICVCADGGEAIRRPSSAATV
jgi:PleD family two-component response regulator